MGSQGFQIIRETFLLNSVEWIANPDKRIYLYIGIYICFGENIFSFDVLIFNSIKCDSKILSNFLSSLSKQFSS